MTYIKQSVPRNGADFRGFSACGQAARSAQPRLDQRARLAEVHLAGVLLLQRGHRLAHVLAATVYQIPGLSVTNPKVCRDGQLQNYQMVRNLQFFLSIQRGAWGLLGVSKRSVKNKNLFRH